MKKTIIAILAVLMLTGCAENTEKPIVNANDNIINSVFENSTSVEEISSSKSEPVESVETENTSSDNISAVENNTTYSQSSSTGNSEETVISTPVSSIAGSTIESKPVSSSSSTSSSSKPVQSSSSISSSSKPVQSSSSISTIQSSTQYSSSKPAEKPAETTPKHNCSTDGHIWKTTYTTTEPKWHRESHIVTNFGFDKDLAQRLYPNLSDTYVTYINHLLNMGVDGASACGSTDVEVWAIETYETKVCTECGYTILSGDAVYSFTPLNVTSENPLGVWRFVNDQNPNATNYSKVGLDFNTIHYDSYNVPQVVIDNINHYWELFWAD